MARRRKNNTLSTESTNQTPSLTARREQVAAELDDRMAKGRELLERPIRVDKDVDSLRGAYYTWDDYNHELLRKRFTSSAIADQYRRSVGAFVVGAQSLAQNLKETHDDIRYKQRQLESIKERLPLYDEPRTEQESVPREPKARGSDGKTVFIVHGHEERTKQEVARFLEKLTPLDVNILHERPNQGRTVIEKFEDHAADAVFAVILLTADDIGTTKTADDHQPLNMRARQNVVFELGFFIGALGRDKVAALYQEGVELPSDIAGVLFTALDPRGAWKSELARELKAAGIEVDTQALL
jgi:predicted nucleotide-binding protein